MLPVVRPADEADVLLVALWLMCGLLHDQLMRLLCSLLRDQFMRLMCGLLSGQLMRLMCCLLPCG